MKPKKKRRTYDRKKQVDTTRARYGLNHYETIGARASTFSKNPQLARLAAWKRWHPDFWDAEGNLLKPIPQKEIKYVNND